MGKEVYLHGYTEKEQMRLISQNETLAKYIYDKIKLENHQNVLEIGCGVGAQMAFMLTHYPQLRIIGLEKEPAQIDKAKQILHRFASAESDRYILIQGDAKDLPDYRHADIDAVVLIWVLEHIPDPLLVLKEIAMKLPLGCKVYATEVFHNSFRVYPSLPELEVFWSDMIEFQSQVGGDANVGMQLGALMHQAGLNVSYCAPYPMFFDCRNIQKRNEMLNYWKELAESAIPEMEAAGLISVGNWPKIAAHFDKLLLMPESIFYYSFVQCFGEVIAR
jgi:SAM-dependent methyltransferase